MQEYRLSFYIMGLFGCVFSLMMFIPATIEYFNGMLNFDVFMNSAAFCLFVSVLIVVTSYTKEATISHRSSFLATTLVWLVITLIAGVPFYFSHYPGYSITIIDALFEASSGITTTGMSILSDLPNVSKGVLLWRAMLQFFGGVGIITLVFIIMPYLQNGTMSLFLTESSENQEKETPRIIDFAMLIFVIYFVFTTVCACFYYLFGMNAFDAICHAMSTVSSGGFGTYDSSFAFFNSASLESIAIFFMALSGVPFIMVVRIFTRKQLVFSSQALVMFYMFTLCSIALFCVYGIFHDSNYATVDHFRHLLFAVVSLGTSTGFASYNLSNYGGFLVFILLTIGVIGGCTGSTSGGIKVFRVQVFYKVLKHHFLKILYPHSVANIKCDGRQVSESLVQSVIILVMLYFLFLMLSTFIVTANGFGLSEAVSVSVAILSNGGMIATEYGSSTSIISNMAQHVRGLFTLLMILGRLEFIAVLIIIIQFFKRT